MLLLGLSALSQAAAPVSDVITIDGAVEQDQDRNTRQLSTVSRLAGWPETGPCTESLHSSPLGFHAQSGQDTWVLQRLMLKCDEGVFVEFGGRDGVQHSNTLFYERHLGWRGLIFEGDAHEFASLKANRPRATVYQGAVCPSRQDNISFGVSSMGGWSGPMSTYEPTRRSATSTVVTMRCYHLAEELRRNQMITVDYMTIDTEGSEVDIIEDFPWGDFDVKVVQIEQLDEKAV
eukprot:5709347-Prymnesium_polylepis.1